MYFLNLRARRSYVYKLCIEFQSLVVFVNVFRNGRTCSILNGVSREHVFIYLMVSNLIQTEVKIKPEGKKKDLTYPGTPMPRKDAILIFSPNGPYNELFGRPLKTSFLNISKMI